MGAARFACSFLTCACFAACASNHFPDAGPANDGSSSDLSSPDLSSTDSSLPLDLSSTDSSLPLDLSSPDLGPPSDGGTCPTGATLCASTCVDTATSLSSCGSCGHPCAAVAHGSAACRASACVVAGCTPPFADCDHDYATGCETSCAPGPCTTSCGSTGTRSCANPCAGAATCTPPVETCNVADDDCNGACDDGASCRTGVYRVVSASEHDYPTSASEATCCGFSIESTNYFYVYTASAPGLVPLYRCLLGDGRHFLTQSATCEGAFGSTVLATLGWVATSSVCGAVALYRLALTDGSHFYTTSAAERDAVVAGGSIDEGIAGYVFTSP